VNKYGNTRITYLGKNFDSMSEADRYCELLCMQRAGEIKDLKLQPQFDFLENGKLIFSYFADFSYTEIAKNKLIIEDVKGMRTDTYKLKKKLIESRHKIKITEVKA